MSKNCGEYQFRYWKRGWRKAVCGACWSLVAKIDVEPHARAHAAAGHEGTPWEHGTVSSFLDVTVHITRRGITSSRTGWLSTGTGPR